MPHDGRPGQRPQDHAVHCQRGGGCAGHDCDRASGPSLITDENLHITPNGYLGRLQETLGIRVEEFAPRAVASAGGAPRPSDVKLQGSMFGDAGRGLVWAEFLHTHSAETVAQFADGDAAGWPAITRNRRGDGFGWYVATQADRSTLARLLDDVLVDAGIGRLSDAVRGVEKVCRGDLVFRINHGDVPVTVELESTDLLSGARAGAFQLAPQGVAICSAAISAG